MWGADWKFRHEGNCSASWGWPSDAEQLSRVAEFSIRTKQLLWILFLAYCSFDNYINAWIVVILSNKRSNNGIFRSRDVRFDSYLRLWRRNIWRKMTSTWRLWRKKWRQNSRSDVMHQSHLTPHISLHWSGWRKFRLGMGVWPYLECKHIRIFHGCEVRTGKSVRGSLFGITRLCRMMPNRGSRGTDFSICTKQPDTFFFLHTLWSPAFDFNVGVDINESHSYTLTSAILKVDIVCDVAMTSSPNVLTTELRDVLYNQCIDNTCCYSFFYLSHGSDKGM